MVGLVFACWVSDVSGVVKLYFSFSMVMFHVLAVSEGMAVGSRWTALRRAQLMDDFLGETINGLTGF